jgi:hypothetical protein
VFDNRDKEFYHLDDGDHALRDLGELVQVHRMCVT